MCCAGCPGSPASAGPSGHSLRGMATLGLPALPPLTGTSVVTQVRLDPLLALMLVLSAGLYLYGVHVLRARGDHWPVARILLFLVPRARLDRGRDDVRPGPGRRGPALG